jgi:hypothetical protein
MREMFDALTVVPAKAGTHFALIPQDQNEVRLSLE